nr:tail fiber assembly protein [Xenorhabdus bovienii]
MADANGLPILVGPPPPTPEELQVQTATKRLYLLNEVDTQIMRLERITRREIATPDEQKWFDAWELYSIELQRLDTTAAPDIDWPKAPK